MPASRGECSRRAIRDRSSRAAFQAREFWVIPSQRRARQCLAPTSANFHVVRRPPPALSAIAHANFPSPAPRRPADGACRATRANRIREKCPRGGIGRRSTMRTPGCPAAHWARRSQRNSARQPSRRATGAKPCSKTRRSPSSAPRWLTKMISPLGLVTRAISSSARSGSGTAVMTYCATTASKNASGKPAAVHPSRPAPRRWQACADGPLVRLAQHRLAIVHPDHPDGRRVIDQ